eukprot:31757-Alexandrium_andersonii.AAC.1
MASIRKLLVDLRYPETQAQACKRRAAQGAACRERQHQLMGWRGAPSAEAEVRAGSDTRGPSVSAPSG